jgi:hypothetical protein
MTDDSSNSYQLAYMANKGSIIKTNHPNLAFMLWSENECTLVGKNAPCLQWQKLIVVALASSQATVK